jgi:hypothetical protein
MEVATTARLSVTFLLIIIGIGVFWYWEGENFTDGAVSGTYVFRLNGETSTLVLRSDHVFEQELESAGMLRRAEGSWSVFGEGHIEFSPELLRVSGAEISASERPTGRLKIGSDSSP